MGIALMAADEDRIFLAIGRLEERFDTLSQKFDDLDERVTSEQRKVHDIVVATSEANRNLTRELSEIKPLAEDYRERRAEDRGAEKFKKWLYGLAASVGGLIAILAGKLIDWLMARPHIPAITIAVITAVLIASGHALGQR